MEDALIVGGALITMLNNADRVKAACLAQLVNVIGPIMTETGGRAWRQTIFHPFAQASRHAHGEVLQSRTESATFANSTHDALPCVLASVVHDPDSGKITILALNRSMDEPVEFATELRSFAGACQLSVATELRHDDLEAINSADEPNKVQPAKHARARVKERTLTATLAPLSWNVFVIEPA